MTDNYQREALALQTVLDTMADGVFVIDKDHTILRWNCAMETLTGHGAAQAVGQPCTFLAGTCLGEEDAARVLQCDLYAGGLLDNHEMRIRRRDGSEVPVLASARVMRDTDGGPVGAVVTFKDMTSVRYLEGELDRLRREVEGRHEFHQIVGKSRAMQEVFNLAELAAASQVTVLVQGETGTGKELVARAIHYAGERKGGPLVTVNCSALSESLLESELFGHMRGAFTGAVSDHVGRFERADGGTLFLDEVGDLPPVVQVKMLRFLQEREFERVGDTRTRKADVRVITATHRDLRDFVRQGLFREDLFYRLKVFPITLPPLRDRKEDIEPLLRKFIDGFNAETGKRIVGVSPDALRIIMDHCWPGNVRELEHAVEHAFVTCPGPYIGPFDLPLEIRRVDLQRQVCDEQADPGLRARTPAPHRPATREELLNALDASGWNKAEAARLLGITRTSVWRRMKTLGIPLDPVSG